MSRQIISEEDFITTVSNNKMVVVNFTASWCGPCKAIAPLFEELASTNPDMVFIKVDVDKFGSVAAQCKVSSMPTFQFYKDKSGTIQFSGANRDKLKESVEKLKTI